MKVYMTGCNKAHYTSNEENIDVMLHFMDQCHLLRKSNTGIHEVNFPIRLSLQQMYAPFTYSNKLIKCCSNCTYQKHPELTNYIMAIEELRSNQQLRKEAKEIAIRKLGL